MKPFLLGLLLTIGACSDSVGPIEAPNPTCTGACDEVSLLIESVRIVGPGTATAFSGDTLHVIVHVRNGGALAPDSNTVLIVHSRNGGDAAVRTGPIRPGTTSRYDLEVVLPPFAGDAVQQRDSFEVRIERYLDWHGPQLLAERTSPAFPFTPSTLQVRNVPAVLRYPSRQVAELIVTNPSPRAIPAGKIEMCVYSVHDCLISGVEPVQLPAVGAGQTLIVSLPLNVTRSPSDNWRWDARDNVGLRVCYGAPALNNPCHFASVDLQPDYEGFCAVRRLTTNATVAGNMADGCGVGAHATALDISSFDLSDGESVVLEIVQHSPVHIEIYSERGERLQVIGMEPEAHFVAPATGRYYLIASRPNWVSSPGSYTVRVERMP